jgi:hypothetical protein
MRVQNVISGVIATTASICLLSACGSDSGSAVHYHSELKPINGQTKFNQASGVANIESDGSGTHMALQMQGVASDAKQVYWVRELPRCPSMKDDTNGDGVIDAVEEAKVAGEIVAVTDHEAEMSVANEGNGWTNLNLIAQKINSSALPNMNNRVLVVHGISESAQVPASVSSVGGLPVFLTIPIACGRIELAKAAQATPTPTPTATPDPTTNPKQDSPTQDTPSQDNPKQNPPSPTPMPTPTPIP